MAEKVFVTGGTGLVGGNLIRKLVDAGYEVSALVRKNSNTTYLDDLPIKKCYGDILQPQSLSEGVKGVDYVFHCAAMVSMWKYAMDRMRKINVEGTENVLRASINAGVKRFFFVSTVDAIGYSTPDGYGTLEKPSTEEIPYQNDWMGIPYSRTKWEAQELVRDAVKKGEIDAVIYNPSFMIGPYDVKPSSGKLIIGVAKGYTRFYTPGGNNFVDVEDVVEAMITGISKARSGELYILGNENLTYKKMFEKIAKIVGVKPPSMRLPYAVAKIAGFFGDLYGFITRREPLISSGEVFLGFLDHYFSPEKARRELDLKSTPIETAIEKAYKWFIDNGYLK